MLFKCENTTLGCRHRVWHNKEFRKSNKNYRTIKRKLDVQNQKL